MKKIREMKITVVVVAVLLVMQVLLTTILVRMLSSTQQSVYDYTFVIDAGHGGIDGGVTGVNGTVESDINLEYSLALQSMLLDRGFNVVMTRTTRDGLYGTTNNGFKKRDMLARREIIQDSHANIVISIHMNEYTSSNRRGPQVFFQQGNEDGRQLANSIQTSFNILTGNSHSALAGDYYICRCSNVASVIVECGFLSNAQDEALLNSDEYREQLLECVLYGAMMYLYDNG